jgi:hypothetical protein
MNRYVMIALALVACGKKDGDKAADKAAAGAPPPAPTVAIDVAAVNNLVPAALKGQLVFEQRDVVNEGLDKTTYTLAAPKDWKQTSKSFGTLEGSGFAKMGVMGDCGGECKVQDWDKMFENMHVKQETSDPAAKVLKNEKAAGRHVLVVERPNQPTRVLVGFWTDGADKANLCSADLSDTLKDAWPAFEKACTMINVVSSKH